MRVRKVVVCSVAVAATMLAAAPSGADVSGEKAALQDIRKLSGRYHAAAKADMDGFIATDACVAVPGLGGMGYHYINPSRLDTTLEADKPEVLLYADGPNGTRRLTGVEYVVVDDDQNLATSDDRPSLGGQPLNGPMPGHEPGMPIHYDLHVWAWAENPNGAFADWNPAITCP